MTTFTGLHVGCHLPFHNIGCPDWAPDVPGTRACPDCGRPQHYTGTEHGWAHDAAFATLACGASPELLAELVK